MNLFEQKNDVYVAIRLMQLIKKLREASDILEESMDSWEKGNTNTKENLLKHASRCSFVYEGIQESFKTHSEDIHNAVRLLDE